MTWIERTIKEQRAKDPEFKAEYEAAATKLATFRERKVPGAVFRAMVEEAAEKGLCSEDGPLSREEAHERTSIG